MIFCRRRVSSALGSVVLICSFASNSAFAQPEAMASGNLAVRLESQVRSSGFKKDDIGIWVSDGTNTLYAVQQDRRFIPASLSKIPTAAATMSLLPQGHKFKTFFAVDRGNSSVGANLKVKNGVLKGPLYLIGGGDPSFVSENLWYLVNELVRSGLTEVDGDLVVDDSRFDSIRFGEDRQSVRVDRAYDAPLGAMSLNWNSVTAWVRPGDKTGDSADVQMDVMSPFIRLQNKTKTGKAGQAMNVAVERLKTDDAAKGETYLASGTIGTGQPEKAIFKSVREPAMWSGQSAKVFLETRGIKIKGTVRSGTAPMAPVVLATSESKQLSLIVSDMMKWSNNYVADMLVKNLGAEGGERPATTRGGMKRVREYLEKNVGFKSGEYEFINGAGFTRENSLTPRQLGEVLMAVRNDFRIFPEFLAALPIAGVDGTLRNRFKGLEGAGWVRAKSGLLDGVIGLAGYAGDNKGRIYTFVLIYNGSAGKEDSARNLFDRLATSLVKAM